MNEVDLVIVGAGLSGCSLAVRLEQLGCNGSIALVEAGRGPGGRMATRHRRDRMNWRLDHGAPGINLCGSGASAMQAVLAPLRENGRLVPEWGSIVGLDQNGREVDLPTSEFKSGEWLRGCPTMASICEGLLQETSERVKTHFARRVRWLERQGERWYLADEQRTWSITAEQLVLSGTLLAHPRTITMLGWSEIPLRQALTEGTDPEVDEVLTTLRASMATVRWNLMLDLNMETTTALPRQIWLTQQAQERWNIERLVLHQQEDNRWGLVVHGLDDGQEITPTSQAMLIAEQEKRLQEQLPDLVQAYPELQAGIRNATSQGVMRWGAAQPRNHPLPTRLQWCSQSRIGFCGDWIEGEGFGRAEGALHSAVTLAERLTTSNRNRNEYVL